MEVGVTDCPPLCENVKRCRRTARADRSGDPLTTTMKDIARDLGLSLMTISKALRNHGDVSEETRKRVLQRARELNYQPNLIAQSLVTKRTYMVGLIIPDLMHSFFAEIAKGIARKLEPLSYQIVIADTEEDAERELKQMRLLLTRKVDGLIIASAQRSSSKYQTAFGDVAIPYVLIDRKPAGVDAHYVGVKDEMIGMMATEHLISQGCRHIAHIRGPEIPTGAGRLRGYRRALARHGFDTVREYVTSGEFSDDAGYLAMQQLLRLPQPPDGVFCYNDPVAAGAIKAALEMGVDVPDGVAIIGAGNVHYSDLLRVPLSTIDQSSLMMGEKAADLLIECMHAKKTPPPREVLIAPRLVARQSTLRETSSVAGSSQAHFDLNAAAPEQRANKPSVRRTGLGRKGGRRRNSFQ